MSAVNGREAVVRIYGHPIGGDDEGPLESEFRSGGMTSRGYGNPEPGCRFFSFAVDYADLDPRFARRRPYALIASEFDFITRQGKYLTCPFGGKIVIEAAP